MAVPVFGAAMGFMGAILLVVAVVAYAKKPDKLLKAFGGIVLFMGGSSVAWVVAPIFASLFEKDGAKATFVLFGFSSFIVLSPLGLLAVGLWKLFLGKRTRRRPQTA